MKVLARGLVCLGLLVLTVAPAFAQFDTATVVGTVRDNTGAVVPGATVTLTNLDTGIAVVTVTDANGNFEFMTVRIGRYMVTAELEGFSIALADNVQVTVGARQRVDLKLEPRQGDRNGGGRRAPRTLLETDSSQRGQVITGEQAVELPLNGREYSGAGAADPRRPRVVDRHRLDGQRRARARSTSTACAARSTTSCSTASTTTPTAPATRASRTR